MSFRPWDVSVVLAELVLRSVSVEDALPSSTRKGVRQETKKRLQQVKRDYKPQDNNMREVWRRMKNITVYSKKNSRGMEFNLLYKWFDGLASSRPASSPDHPSPAPASTSPPTTTAASPCTAGHSSPSFTTEQVSAELKRQNPGQAAGPDRVCPQLLKEGAAQFAVPL